MTDRASDVEAFLKSTSDVRVNPATEDKQDTIIANQTNNTQLVKTVAQDSPDLDAFSRKRISQPFGIFDFKPISGRGKNVWFERLTGCIMNISGVTGTPTVGDTVTGGTSAKTGTVTGVAGTVITYDTEDNDWTDTEALTFAGVGPGANATLTNHNTGADVTYDYDGCNIALSLGTVSGQKVIRQTTRYFSYVPGKSHKIDMTADFNVGKTGLKQTIMYGDALNGLGLVLDETTVKLLKRTSTSGAAVDTTVSQSSWNIDVLDGTSSASNPSGILLDIDKSQIYAIDFQWLGVGRVRMALDINGTIIPVHEFNHANLTEGVYMRTPTLPIRYEIENTATTTGASTLKQICCSVSSEGGFSPPGVEWSAGLTFAQEVAVTTRRPIFAIRLKDAYPTGKPNRRTFKFEDFELACRTDDATFEFIHVHDPLTMTATWTDIDTESSGLEYSTDISALTARHFHVVQGPINIFSGQAGKGGASNVSSEFINNHSYISQNVESNNSEMFVIYATAESATANCTCHITGIEFE